MKQGHRSELGWLEGSARPKCSLAAHWSWIVSGIGAVKSVAMGWSGIWCVHVPNGVDPQDAIDATVVSWIAWDGEEVSIEPNTHPPEVEIDPSWAQRARGVLLSVNPDLREIDEYGTLDDGRGPVWITVYPVEVQLKPKNGWWSDEIDGFAVMWAYCLALAEQARCVAHDSEEEGLIDLSLDAAMAGSIYNWL